MKSTCVRLRSLLLATLLLLTSLSPLLAGGRSCKRCGCEKHVKPVLQLVKVCEEVELPEYACLKQEAYFPDKGSVCYSGYRCDTYCKFWRDCVCHSKGQGDLPLIQDPLQTSHKQPLPPFPRRIALVTRPKSSTLTDDFWSPVSATHICILKAEC